MLQQWPIQKCSPALQHENICACLCSDTILTFSYSYCFSSKWFARERIAQGTQIEPRKTREERESICICYKICVYVCVCMVIKHTKRGRCWMTPKVFPSFQFNTVQLFFISHLYKPFSRGIDIVPVIRCKSNYYTYMLHR